jgi:DNA-binding transcriptional ArsR family regulator
MVEHSAQPFMFNWMVEQSPAGLDRVFGALSDPTRRAMLRRLAGGTRTVASWPSRSTCRSLPRPST